MACAAVCTNRLSVIVAETQNTGFTLSETSLKKAHIRNFENNFSSFPLVKPVMRLQPCQEFFKILKKIEKVCNQGFNRFASTSHQEENLSLDDSKYIIRELAAELDRVVQFKKVSKVVEKMNDKETEEEQQHYILQWAEELESLEGKQVKVKVLQEENHAPSENSKMESEIKWTKAKGILSNLETKRNARDVVSQNAYHEANSVCPNGEYRETLKNLHKQCKQGESSILSVMDWMVWTVLQSESCEDSSPRQWMKKKQRSKNTVGLPIPNSVWDWITESTGLIVLDPNTANPDLQVSENEKSLKARHFDKKCDNWKGFQRNNSRYDGWTCVQAKEGYKTGRHYWEVNVRKKREWRVGVVKESAPRHGYVTMNTKTGYWNLRLQLGTLMALTEPVSKLYISTPSKIGVYLDIEEGQVSFYDAEKRRHIYTFNTDFEGTEYIYPMFGTIETDRALVIS